MRLSVRIPDEKYWKELISCQHACPVHTDARGYVRAIAEADYRKAYLIARGPNPMASVCGRVCSAPCEEACRRGDVDEPISIRALKRFVTEPFGTEAGAASLAAPHNFQKPATSVADHYELAHLQEAISSGLIPDASGKRVAIIGAGPAGLTCAHDLALVGVSPVIFEMESTPAGMMYTGIPEFRLPREVLDSEIQAIVDLGVEIRCDTTVGEDVSFAALREEFDAVVISVGAKNSKSLGIPGEDGKGVFGGVEFLRSIVMGESYTLGKKVVVLGGGFTALDCSRSSLRVGVDSVVNVLYRRTEDEMPVSDQELEEAKEEGVGFEYLVTPLGIEKGADGEVVGVRLQQNRLGPPDASGRRRPEPIEGSERVHPCDTVVLAIGQQTDLAFIDSEKDGLPFNKWGLLDCDEETLGTKAPDVFMAGDAALGAANIVTATASGKTAARSVIEYLTGKKLTTELSQSHETLEAFGREIGYEELLRTSIPLEDVKQRLADPAHRVETGYDEELAVHEASRCLDCGVNTIFDGERCVLCGGCSDVCPNSCLKLVALSELELTEEQQQAAAGALGSGWAESSAIIKDDAITMERMNFAEVLK
jgi:NADPH-dependent glutamate synthase beta subunit-like oxidoreductase